MHTHVICLIEIHLSTSSTPSSASAQLVHIFYTMCKIICDSDLPKARYCLGFKRECSNCEIYEYSLLNASSSDRQNSQSAARYNRRQRWNTSTTQNVYNAITMHTECKESVEHHVGTLRNNENESVTERSCKVMCCSYGQNYRHTNLSSSYRAYTSWPSIPHACEKRNHGLPPRAIRAIARTYIGCTLVTGARTCNIMHRRLRIRRDSRNSIRQTRYIAKQLAPHYRLHQFLIATSGATTIWAQDHI